MHRQPQPEPQTHAPRTSIVGLRDASADRSLRAGDDDRRRVADLLQAHYVAGRLTQSELEGRLQEAVEAKTLADLDALLNDLPDLGRPADDEPAPTSRAERAEAAVGCGEQSFRRHAISYLLVIGMLVAIWALTSPGGYFWPVWPMLGWGVGLAWHRLNGRTRPRHRDGHWSGFSGH